MDISQAIKKLKENPDFTENVGMLLIHNGVVRAWSRKDRSPVEFIDVSYDMAKIESLRLEYEQKPGIYKIIIEVNSGRLTPGDDLLFIIVAGDIRENVKPVLADLLDRVKAEAVIKNEIFNI